MPFEGQRSTPACDFSDADVTVSIFEARLKKTHSEHIVSQADLCILYLTHGPASSLNALP